MPRKINYLFKVRNDSNGRNFIALLRAHLNTDTYRLRLKGNHSNRKSVGGDSWYTPLETSEEIRIYIQDKTTGRTVGANQNDHIDWLYKNRTDAPFVNPVPEADIKLGQIRNIINS